MAVQIGVQSGAKTSVHNHMNISNGGVICIEQRTVGANVTIANADPRSTNSGVFVRVKEILIQEVSPGTCTVYFTLTRTAGAGIVNGRLYVNGVAVGVDHPSNPGPDIWNDVLALNLVIGDRVQIYAHGTGANTATVEDMQIQYSNSLLSVASHALVTVLPTTYVVPIQTFNNDP